MTDPQTIHVEAVDWSDIGYQLAAGLAKLIAETKAGDGLAATLAKKEGVVLSVVLEVLDELALSLGEALHKAEQPFLPIIAAFVAPIVQGLFGAHVDESVFRSKLTGGAGAPGAQAIVNGFMQAIAGERPGDLAPGDAGARRLASAAVQASLESNFNALVPELLSHILPFDIGHFGDLLELPESIIRALGTGRLVQRALRPLVTATCTTPLQWHVNKLYGPELLSVGDAVKARNQGALTDEQLHEELARQGFNAKRAQVRIDLETAKLSAGDIRTGLELGKFPEGTADSYLRNLGYDETRTEQQLDIWRLQRRYDRAAAVTTRATAAFVDGTITRADLQQILETQIPHDELLDAALEYADLARALNTRRLSLSQVEAMVKSGVLAFVDYREAAERDGYGVSDVIALELQLRYEVDKQTSLEQHRANIAQERAAAAAARDAARAARQAQIEADRALGRRGAESDLEDAVVRGLIPLARLEEVYRARYDADTVDVLVAVVEQRRQEYIAHQNAVDEARKRGARRAVNVDGLVDAFNRNLLTGAELRARLAALAFDPADVELLAAAAESRKADIVAAKKKRDDAAKIAKTRSIDLPRFERLVRRGARTIPQYVALLESLGVDEASRAAFVDLLQLQIADDARARDERDKAAAAPPAKGLTLEQERRGVLLGTLTEDQFQTYLVANHYTSDAQLVLLAELRADVEDAAAARQRRTTPEAGPATPGLPLATVRRAAQLGVITPDAYAERLAAAGYSDDDVELDLELLLVEIADTQAARQRREQTPSASAPAGLSLGELSRAVKAGAVPLAVYQARALELGYSSADAQLLASVLERELQTLTAARQAHDNLALRLAANGVSLPAVDADVRAGTLSLGAYAAQLEAYGSSTAEAQLVASFLAWQLDQAAEKGS
jgi:hypothetical protein